PARRHRRKRARPRRDRREVPAAGGADQARPARGRAGGSPEGPRRRPQALAQGAEARLPRGLGRGRGALAMPRRKSISDEDILDRALPLMARAGPAGFTLAEVARAVGLAPATLVQRFGDKQTLIERAFARDNQRFLPWLESLPQG